MCFIVFMIGLICGFIYICFCCRVSGSVEWCEEWERVRGVGCGVEWSWCWCEG